MRIEAEGKVRFKGDWFFEVKELKYLPIFDLFNIGACEVDKWLR